ncbi:MAG: AlbA family DNA-binding domain-containing protein [Dermatophilaceae bacterium]
MTEVFLSPEVPRWLPTTEQEIEEAASNGLLVETHYLDLKREVSRGDGANKELARDLAQFAIDGGALLIGLDEQDDGPPRLTPVELTGLPERVEQVAASRCDPPLHVACTAIWSSADPTRGYLLVAVPPSALAPHMVDGAYFGRGDTTKRRLSDPEVLRHHAARQQTDDRINALLDKYIRRDPIPEAEREQAHFSFVAAPMTPRHEMLLDAVTGDHWQANLNRFIDAARLPDDLPGPPLERLVRPDRRADGVAMVAGLDASRQLSLPGGPEEVLEIEFTDEGMARMLNTWMTGDHQRLDGRTLVALAPVTSVLVGIKLAAAVGAHTQYGGAWLVGFALTGAAGLQVDVGHSGFRAGGVERVPADADEYRATTVVTTAELRDRPGAVTRRLVGRYVRSIRLENDQRILDLLAD